MKCRAAAAVAFAITGACGGASAAAVTPQPLEEIVVTARKMTEPLATVPLAIDVVAADALPSGLPLDLYRLAMLSPGLYFESLWGGLARVAWAAFLGAAGEIADHGTFAGLNRGTPFAEIDGAFPREADPPA